MRMRVVKGRARNTLSAALVLFLAVVLWSCTQQNQSASATSDVREFVRNLVASSVIPGELLDYADASKVQELGSVNSMADYIVASLSEQIELEGGDEYLVFDSGARLVLSDYTGIAWVRDNAGPADLPGFGLFIHEYDPDTYFLDQLRRTQDDTEKWFVYEIRYIQAPDKARIRCTLAMMRMVPSGEGDAGSFTVELVLLADTSGDGEFDYMYQGHSPRLAPGLSARSVLALAHVQIPTSWEQGDASEAAFRTNLPDHVTLHHPTGEYTYDRLQEYWATVDEYVLALSSYAQSWCGDAWGDPFFQTGVHLYAPELPLRIQFATDHSPETGSYRATILQFASHSDQWAACCLSPSAIFVDEGNGFRLAERSNVPGYWSEDLTGLACLGPEELATRLADPYSTEKLIAGSASTDAHRSTELDGSIVAFRDKGLEEAVRLAIRRPTGDIYESDLARIMTLYASGFGIRSLDGIEQLKNLRELNASSNEISDLTPLRDLQHLVTLYLMSNQIVDLSPLSSLSNIADLGLPDNRIREIGALEQLGSLVIVDLSENQLDLQGQSKASDTIRSLESRGIELWYEEQAVPVSFGDPKLEDEVRKAVHIRTGPVYGTDLLGLTELRAVGRGISRLDGLEHCKDLVTLDLRKNQIIDIAPLGALDRLERLELADNQIVEIAPLCRLTDFMLKTLGDNTFLLLSATSFDAERARFLDLAPISIDLDAVREIPGVEAAALIKERPAFIEGPIRESGSSLYGFIPITGLSPEFEQFLGRLEIHPDGRMFQPGEVEAVVLGEEIADHLGADVGDTILLAGDGSSELRPKVVGIVARDASGANHGVGLEEELAKRDPGGVFVPLETWDILFHPSATVLAVLVRVANGMDVKAVAGTAASSLGNDDERITAVTYIDSFALECLRSLRYLDLQGNGLDLAAESHSTQLIGALEERGVEVRR
ncbi:leucine-rich repeat domain-containing protein [Candidatus Bipolaricaulota bacterium]